MAKGTGWRENDSAVHRPSTATADECMAVLLSGEQKSKESDEKSGVNRPPILVCVVFLFGSELCGVPSLLLGLHTSTWEVRR